MTGRSAASAGRLSGARTAAFLSAVVLAAAVLAAAASYAGMPPLPPHQAFADGETTCSISVLGTAHPVHYDGSVRRNPDGTVYPGDAAYYLFRYEAKLYGSGQIDGPGPGTCDSLRAGPVEARGRYSAAGAMSVAGPSAGFDPSPHPSVHIGLDAAWLRTDHYFRVWWEGYDCRTVPYIRVYACERVGLHTAGSPSFSVRSDDTMSARERAAHDHWLHGGPNRGFEVRPTHDLHLVEASTPGGAPPGLPPPDHLEDAASAAAFAAAVRAACSSLPAGSGCVFGRAEVEPRSSAGRECLSGIMASRMPALLAPPRGPPGGGPIAGDGSPTRAEWVANPSLKRISLAGGTWNASAPVSEMVVDECMRSGERVALAVSALQVRHDPAYEHAHRTVRVERTALAPAAISEPHVRVALERPPILDADGHPSANADGTYYGWDLPSVHVRPSVLFGAERHGTLSFAVERKEPAPLPEAFSHSCSGAPACDVAVRDGGVHISETLVRSAHGDRLDVFRPDAGSTGNHTARYEIVLLNIGRPVEGTEAALDAVVRVVPYEPWYSAALAYTALAGPGRTTLEKMHALALRYEGSLERGADGGWEAQPGRRSKVSSADAFVAYGHAAAASEDGAVNSTMSLRGADGLAGIASSAPPAALASLPERARGPWGSESAPVSLALRGHDDAPGNGSGVTATAVIGGAGIARLLLAHDPPGPPGMRGAEGQGTEPAAVVGGILLNATVESRMFGGRNATHLASYSYSYPAAHVSAPINATAVESGGQEGHRRPAHGVRVEAALVPARGAKDAVPLAAFMLDHLELTAALRSEGLKEEPDGRPRAGIVTADATASSIEIDGNTYGLALVEPLRGPGGGRDAAADAAARAVCPRGSAVLYDADNGTGDLFGAPQVSVECDGVGLNGALVAGGHARIRTAMCAHSEFALRGWAARGCAPAAADAASVALAGPRGPDAAVPAAGPFPAAAFAAAYAGDMHDASNRAEGQGSAAGTAGVGHTLAVPAAGRMLASSAAAQAVPALGTVSGRYGEAAALGSPPPYDLVVSAGGGTAAVHVGPHAFSSPVWYEFAVGPSPGGIVAEPGAPSHRTARVRAAEWFGTISELHVDGVPYASAPGQGGGGGWAGAGAGGPPCRPYCEVRIEGAGGTAVEAFNAWGGTASLSLDAAVTSPAGSGTAGAAAERAYGPAVAYAEASVPYLVAACIAAACAVAYGRFAAASAGGGSDGAG